MSLSKPVYRFFNSISRIVLDETLEMEIFKKKMFIRWIMGSNIREKDLDFGNGSSAVKAFKLRIILFIYLYGGLWTGFSTASASKPRLTSHLTWHLAAGPTFWLPAAASILTRNLGLLRQVFRQSAGTRFNLRVGGQTPPILPGITSEPISSTLGHYQVDINHILIKMNSIWYNLMQWFGSFLIGFHNFKPNWKLRLFNGQHWHFNPSYR